eukprot:scaffold31928_cov62-Phaeocystis_antarctica.AAC.6
MAAFAVWGRIMRASRESRMAACVGPQGNDNPNLRTDCDTLQAHLAIPFQPCVFTCARLCTHAAHRTAIIHTIRAQCASLAICLPSPISFLASRDRARASTRQPTLAISAPPWPRDLIAPLPLNRTPPRPPSTA